MERLTRKINDKYYCKPADQWDGTELFKANQKLGPLEDIEEELEIDLLTLFRALTEQIYVYAIAEGGEPHFVQVSGKWNFINVKDKCLDSYLDTHPHKLYFKDYGDVWAVTKEELER